MATVQKKIEEMFPHDRLKLLKVSPTVRSMNISDLNDMARVFSVPPEKVENKRVEALTTHDLMTIEELFSESRAVIIANFEGVHNMAQAMRLRAEGGGCSCCTPCCCCTAAANTETAWG